ncbi:hypothetical protein LCGC14_2981390, partial [marine sediment metagenome]
ILMILGWRLFFYANERNEPAHIHCSKANCECKYLLDSENYVRLIAIICHKGIKGK